MSSDMTPEQAVQAVQEASGKDALEALHGKLEDALQVKVVQAAAVQGEITALKQVIRLLESLTKDTPKGASPSEEKLPDLGGESDLEKERKDRLIQNCCTFRDRNKKWCQRKLKTKIEKSEGYCGVHLCELGITERTPSGKITYIKGKKE